VATPARRRASLTRPGLGLPDRDLVRALASVIDPADVRWIWLTHPDRDYTGGLFDLLDAAPLADRQIPSPSRTPTVPGTHLMIQRDPFRSQG
jgi:glyoxylase-like metal-dependent hydrolase (beta-lactamase superfamily II)